ncbi:peptidoglycan-binding protein [Ectobacillus ponti]|uniref:Glycosyl hydrolase family 18 protein n=1 Tax=Ectobacillus ponti TaxID=2961894 RepID=A0AA41X256_9BACI|nr:glycosyl hydrolase family 18 protein [Ectobacillus ponti]MCP8967551.1 glycosyl hydrolase family 18 protein [Ectobacillus ponti]
MFLRHKLVEIAGEYEVVLYLEPFTMELAAELGAGKEARHSIREAALRYIKDKLPHAKIASVAIMAGSFLVTAFPMQKASAHEADFNMSYLFFGGTNTYIQQVDRTKGNLNTVAPSYFNINSDGTLQVGEEWDPRMVTEMHNRGIRVVPFLSNHWDRALGRTALANREQLSGQIADFIVQHNLDGVNVDIENVTEADRDAYTDLVRLLRQKLPAGKEVSVAVAVNPEGWNTGWQGSYDYAGLARYADYLMLMAYDESYQGGPAGSVASYSWVERSIQYALGQGVAPEKVVLGLPFFGRYWKEGAVTGGYGMPAHQAEELVRQYGGTAVFDPVTRTPMATITIREGDQLPVVYGRTMTPGTYHIYYENAESIREKIQLVHQYNLKGTGSWSLGGEDVAVWGSYKSWMMTHNNEAVPVAAAPRPAPSLVPPAAKPAKGYPLLKYGVKGKAVSDLQNALKQNGFYRGAVNGAYDSGTRNAVISFQRKYKLAADGIAGTQTQSKLYALKPPAAKKLSYQTLKAGSRGTEVKRLQEALHKLGYLREAPSSYYGASTKAAVTAFQKKQRLAADGIAGVQTQTKLYSLVK